jgi:hypothetical protein
MKDIKDFKYVWRGKEWWCPICGWQYDFDIDFEVKESDVQWSFSGNVGDFKIYVLVTGPKCQKCQITMKKSRRPKELSDCRLLKI